MDPSHSLAPSSSSFPSAPLASEPQSLEIKMEKLEGKIKEEEKKEEKAEGKLEKVENSIKEEMNKGENERDKELLNKRKADESRIRTDLESITSTLTSYRDTLKALNTAYQRLLNPSSTFPSSSAPGSSSSLAFPSVFTFDEIASLSNSVARVFTRTQTDAANNRPYNIDGQAVCIIQSTLFITAAHVCFGSDEDSYDKQGEKANKKIKRPKDDKLDRLEVSLHFYDRETKKSTLYSAELIRYSATMDVAILKLMEKSSSEGSIRCPFITLPFISDLAVHRKFLLPSLEVFLVSYSPLADAEAADGKEELSLSSEFQQISIIEGLVASVTAREYKHLQVKLRRYHTGTSAYLSVAGDSGGAVICKESNSGQIYLLGIHLCRVYLLSEALKVSGFRSDDEEEGKEKNETQKKSPSASAASSSSSSRTSSPSLGSLKHDSTPELSTIDSQEESRDETSSTHAGFIYTSDLFHLQGWTGQDLLSLASSCRVPSSSSSSASRVKCSSRNPSLNHRDSLRPRKSDQSRKGKSMRYASAERRKELSAVREEDEE
jgi:hypothetical protein